MSTAEKEKTKTREVPEIKRELDRASAALSELQREQAGIASRLKEAGKEDQAELTQAALSGSLKKVKTPRLDKVRARAAELPFLLWAAEVRVLELSEEHAAAKSAELEAEVQELYPRVVEAEAAANGLDGQGEAIALLRWAGGVLVYL